MTTTLRPGAMPVGRQAWGLVVVLGLTFACAAVGGFASAQAGAFYQQLVRPPWAPPGSWFGPVWGVLYTLMAVAAWLVWRRGGIRAAPLALGLYALQLLVNALWTWLFFAWHMGAAALADVVLLALLIAATAWHFRRVSAPAALLLLPYLAWVLFACALTYATWQLNPALLA